MSDLSVELARWKDGEIEVGSKDMAIHVRQLVKEELARERKTLYLVTDTHADGHDGPMVTVRDTLEAAVKDAEFTSGVYGKNPQLNIAAVRIDRVEILETVATLAVHASEDHA